MRLGTPEGAVVLIALFVVLRNAVHAVNLQASTLRPSIQLGSLGSSLLHCLPSLLPFSVLWVSHPTICTGYSQI